MNIGIIGAGNVGGTLGRGWAAKGHQVRFGSRRPEAGEVTLAEAAASDVLALATPWGATRQVLSGLGDLRGKILLDCTNPLLPNFALEFAATTSGAEQVAAWASGARVVKIFNTTGFNVMANPSFAEGRATMFYCGDDPEAKRAAASLAADLGFDPQDAGPLEQARLLEPLALLWISLALKYGYGREMAFRLMRR